jgi:hypothetical protein
MKWKQRHEEEAEDTVLGEGSLASARRLSGQMDGQDQEDKVLDQVCNRMEETVSEHEVIIQDVYKNNNNIYPV